MKEFDPKGTFGNDWRHFIVVYRGMMIWVASGSEIQAHGSSTPPNTLLPILKYQLCPGEAWLSLAQGFLVGLHEAAAELCFTDPHPQDPQSPCLLCSACTSDWSLSSQKSFF